MGGERDSIRDIWGPRTPTADGQWPVRVDERVEAEHMRRLLDWLARTSTYTWPEEQRIKRVMA